MQAALEDNIFKLETAYLEETSAGNIVKGFDNYIKGSAGIGAGGGAGAGTATRRKAAINDADRIFSRSSASFLRVCLMGQRALYERFPVSTHQPLWQDSPAPNSAHTTPSHAPTPTSSFPSARESNHPTPSSSITSKAASSKKKKASEKDDEDTDSKPNKRGKITYGRE